MMDGTFVEEFAAKLQPAVKVVSVRGLEHLVLRASDGSFDLAAIEHPAPMAKALEVATLTALVDMVREGVEDIDYDNAFLHVASPTSVTLCHPASSDPFARRRAIMTSTATPPAVGFGSYYPVESWIITLLSCFAPTPDLAEVVALLSNLRDEKVKAAQDDGLGQTVTVKAGVTLVGERRVPTTPKLAPRRTFTEIEQPASSFLLRLKSGTDGGPMQAALFEADGGAWKAEAMLRVKAWLDAAIGALDKERRLVVLA